MKELIVTLHHLNATSEYISSGVDAIVVGNEAFSSRLPISVSLIELQELLALINKRMKVYVEINHFIHEDAVASLREYLTQLNQLDIDAVIFQDFAVVQILKELNSSIDCHYNPETLNTNYATMNFLKQYGLSRFTIARELSKEEMVSIAMQAQVETEIQIHGVMYVAHSKRELLSNYLDFEGIDTIDKSIHGGLTIRADNQEKKEHIFEDQAGTHILTEDIFCTFEAFEVFLASPINAFRIDTLFAYRLDIIQAYRSLMDAYEQSVEHYNTVKKQLRPTFNDPLFYEGFINDETVYTIEKVREREEDEKR